MSQNPKPEKKKPFPILPVVGIAAVFLVLITAGGFAFAASQESHDAFCASCHTQPESTFYERSTSAQPVDLASYHTAKNTNCIDCHSGQGLTGRLSAEIMGARNAALWYTGTAVQPAVLSFPIGDQNCLKCHADVTQRGYTPKTQVTLPGIRGGGRGGGEAGNNHWHEQMAKWQATSANAGTCNSCHSGHLTDGTSQTAFVNSQTVQAVCDACHQVLRRGD
jgi:nitrate/TMAO reductase-like tetraheme cytochrome c subunit